MSSWPPTSSGTRCPRPRPPRPRCPLVHRAADAASHRRVMAATRDGQACSAGCAGRRELGHDRPSVSAHRWNRPEHQTSTDREEPGPGYTGRETPEIDPTPGSGAGRVGRDGHPIDAIPRPVAGLGRATTRVTEANGCDAGGVRRGSPWSGPTSVALRVAASERSATGCRTRWSCHRPGAPARHRPRRRRCWAARGAGQVAAASGSWTSRCNPR